MTPRSRRITGLAAGGALLLLIPLLPLTAQAAEQPTAVAVAGDLDSELGCGGDWAPDCDQAQMNRRESDGVWQLTADLPAGPFAYKAALDKSWDVNYGLNAAPGGANIPITVPDGGANVSFFYDHDTHWITDTLTAPIATAAGDFQNELGCPSDWSPDCLRSWLQDPDGDDTYTFTTTALLAGTYRVKATLGMSWNVNYGQDGVQSGNNIAFSVPTDAAKTTFSYDAPSHTLTVYTGDARPSLQAARAHWLTPDVIAWKLTGDPATRTYELGGSPDGGLRAGPSGLTGGVTIPLTYDPAGMPAGLKANFPHLSGYGVLRVPAGTDVAGLLRGQVAAAAINADGALADASSLQIPGVLDAIYGTKASRARLGPVHRAARPTLSVWAPTARTAGVELYDSASDTEPTLVPMRRDDTTGVWSVTGDRTWDRKYYRYQIKVFAPAAMQVITNSVTDPYSLALSTDSKLSQIVDLGDRDLTPRGWNAPRLPDVANTRQQIQELHIGDFSTEDTTVPATFRGTYQAFTDTDSAGMRHLRELARSGVTTVHLLPTFDFGGVPENPANRDQPPCDLKSYPADSDQQQACIAKTQTSDDFNWGYNPLHYTVPEGSYATRPDGATRTRQFRAMVQALHDAGLRVVLDVVYNHTAAAGQDPNSVLDRIVPGYYQRLSLNGTVTTDSCCADTAPEHTMMNKLVVDSAKTWAEQYKIDGFRFDLMGLDPKQTMLDVQTALDPLPGTHFLYGEGWDYGVVANNARFVQATQANMAGTGIGTFNDRLRDAVRGGSVFDDNPRIQGFGNGLFTNPNGDPVNGDNAAQKTRLLTAMDLVKLGLTGNLRNYTFRSTTGGIVKGSDLVYDGRPAGYTAQPGEAVTYVDAHDNLALYDINTYKLPAGTTPADRARLQSLALGVTALSQGAGFAQAGTDLLRSKSFDGNSYDSGDWFNAIHWDCRTGNGFGRGLPLGADNEAMWPYAKPLLADPVLVPECRTMTATTTQYQQFLRIKKSSKLFSLGTADEVQKRISFPLSGTDAEIPGVITQRLDGAGLRGKPSLTVVYNATPHTQRQTIAALVGTRQTLHEVQAGGKDSVVKRAGFDRNGTFTVPAYTIAVFVQQ